jgi:hypothetical protein
LATCTTAVAEVIEKGEQGFGFFHAFAGFLAVYFCGTAWRIDDCVARKLSPGPSRLARRSPDRFAPG